MKLISSALIFVLLLLAIKTSAANEPYPKWFPQKSCREAWSNLIPQNLHHYNAKRDGPYKNYVARLNRKNCFKDWAILVFAEAENDLSPYALLDLYEMESGYESGERRAASTLKTDLLVEADLAGPTGIRRLHMFQSEASYDNSISVADIKTWDWANIQSPIIEHFDEKTEKQKYSTAQRLQKFLDWGMREYPAQHYMVVLWGHGQGWRGTDTANLSPESLRPSGFGGILFDHDTNTFLDIPTLKDVLKSVTQNTLEGKKIDIYASDACLMQMFEVSAEIASATNFIVGSTQVQNFLGLPYRRLLYELNSGRFAGYQDGDEPYKVSMMIPDLLKSSLAAQGLQGRMSPEGRTWLTMNSISSSELMSYFLPEFKKFVLESHRYIQIAPENKIPFQLAIKNTPNVLGGAKDLNVFLNLIKYEIHQSNIEITAPEQRLLQAINSAQTQLLRAVMNRSLGTEYESESYRSVGFRGFSVWLPETREEYLARSEDFKKSRLYELLSDKKANQGWNELIGLLAR